MLDLIGRHEVAMRVLGLDGWRQLAIVSCNYKSI